MAVLHLVWMILNLGLSAGLMIIFSSRFSYFSRRYGALPTGLLFLFILAMCQSSGKKQGESVRFETTLTALPQLDPVTTRTISLLDLPTISLDQGVYINRRDHPDSVHIQSYVVLTGFTAGLGWSLLHTEVGISPDYRLHYSTVGIMVWSLLGIPIYSQEKYFNGAILLEHAVQNFTPTAHTLASGPCPERNGLLGS